MKYKPSPTVVHVDGAMNWAVDGAVTRAVYGTVDETVCAAVYRAVYGAVYWSMFRAMYATIGNRPLHPNLERFVAEIHQFQEDAT